MKNRGSLFIVSAPSGAGKSSLISALLKQNPDHVQVSVSHTTRQPRVGEENGKHYHFVDQAQFKTMIANDEFFEWAEVFGNYYGTSKTSIESQLDAGIDVFLDIDWQGARQVKKLIPDSFSIFILPPSREELERRLIDRGQDSAEVVQQRMDKAISEMSHFNEFDKLIVNDDFETALTQLQSIVNASRLSTSRQSEIHAKIIKELLAQ